MRAVQYERFGGTPRLVTLPDPAPPPHGAVVEVAASGVCRSDWHGWVGHDPDISLPHVPGHEFAGVVAAVGPEVRRFSGGERVTAPFVAGCGRCPECASGNQQVCPAQTQPGFTHWGSFAQYVVVHHADTNLVRLPDEIGFVESASLGCRFATAYHALADQGRVRADEWVAVHGCGGVGLSAVMIARARGARVVAIDVDEQALALARSVGATASIDAGGVPDVGAAVRELTAGGAHVSIDAAGSGATARASLESLRRRGRHLQVGLLLGPDAEPVLPMGPLIAHELRIIGVHGMPAHRYDAMLAMIAAGELQPRRLVGRTIGLDQAIEALTSMGHATARGLTVIDTFQAPTTLSSPDRRGRGAH